ncbi:hypothetical protein QR680_017661 [Steinernema hermaphroditum]|uniref:Uncharacterized protein n=1 Tax=Steinernema hermaphroditum TaxID=289476 RepID=A0AA39HFD6_9BILA|nr:hypothetical protein QR680_017661 [Steinernema hermaphroditum]
MAAGRCCRTIPFGSILATCVAAAGCIVFFVNYDKALTKFILQINTVYKEVKSEDLINLSTKTITIPVSIGFCALAIAFLISNCICTAVVARSYYSNIRSHDENIFTRIFANPVIAAVDIAVAYVWLLAWAALLCAAAFVGMLYVGFINVVKNICTQVLDQNKCIDLKENPLTREIVQQLLGFVKIPDIKICPKDTGIICGEDNDETWTLLGGFIACFVALIGIVHFLMCMSANFARLLAMRRELFSTVRLTPYTRSADETQPYSLRPHPAPRKVFPENGDMKYRTRRGQPLY